MRGYERQESHRADDDHLSRFEAEMDRLKTDREKAVQHAEDLGYQVEVLRAKLHEARRNLATRPAMSLNTILLLNSWESLKLYKNSTVRMRRNGA